MGFREALWVDHAILQFALNGKGWLPPFAKNAKKRGTHCVGNARKIKSPGLV